MNSTQVINRIVPTKQRQEHIVVYSKYTELIQATPVPLVAFYKNFTQ